MLIYELHMLYGLQQHIIFKHYTLPKWGYTYSISEANNPKQWSQWRRYGGGICPPKEVPCPPNSDPTFIDHFMTFQKTISPKILKISIWNFQGMLSRLMSVSSRTSKILSLFAPCHQLFKLALPFCVVFQHHSKWRPQACPGCLISAHRFNPQCSHLT